MKKILILFTFISLSLFLVMSSKAYAYTLSNVTRTYYNQTTDTIGTGDTLDITDTMISWMYYDLGYNTTSEDVTIRLVFSNSITTSILPIISSTSHRINIEISFYNASHNLIYTSYGNWNAIQSMSYYEHNFRALNNNALDYIVITIDDLPIGYDEVLLHSIMQGAIIVSGNSMIINQTIGTTQYSNGWADAMASKVEQIWSLWNNIFNTFMSVFNVFSIKLMGDITIGHIALVPLVLGLIGFIYALGGKRGR